MWQKVLQDFIIKHKELKIEIESAPEIQETFQALLSEKTFTPKMLIVVPHKLPLEAQNAIKEIVPSDLKYEYIERIKASTVNQIKFLAMQAGCTFIKNKAEGRNMFLELGPSFHKELESHDSLWGNINKEFYDDGYFDTWEIKCGELQLFYNRKAIDEISKRPPRDRYISNEDTSDLKIALEVCKDVNDFIAVLEGRPLVK